MKLKELNLTPVQQVEFEVKFILESIQKEFKKIKPRRDSYLCVFHEVTKNPLMLNIESAWIDDKDFFNKVSKKDNKSFEVKTPDGDYVGCFVKDKDAAFALAKELIAERMVCLDEEKAKNFLAMKAFFEMRERHCG